MPKYRYQGRDADGNLTTGVWESADPRLAGEELRQRGVSLLHLEEESLPLNAMPDPGGWDLGVSAKELARFTRQLSTMLRAGLPLLKALESVSRRSAGPSLRRAVCQVARRLHEGARFSEALTSQPQVFDELYISLVRVGEVGGDLDGATERLALLLEREVTARRRVGMAMLYPVIVLSVAGLLTWALATFMMPIFEPMFKESGLNLERDYRITWLLLQAGHLGGSPLFLGLVAALAVGGMIAGRVAGRFPAGRLLLDRVKLVLPVVAGLYRMLLTARLARSLAALTRGGIPLVQSLTQAGLATGNRVFASMAEEMAQGVQQGRHLSQELAAHPLFHPALTDMVEVGEQSGTLPAMLERAADYFDDEADERRDMLTLAMEPFMMLLVGSIVSIFVVALMVPLMALSHH